MRRNARGEIFILVAEILQLPLHPVSFVRLYLCVYALSGEMLEDEGQGFGETREDGLDGISVFRTRFAFDFGTGALTFSVI